MADNKDEPSRSRKNGNSSSRAEDERKFEKILNAREIAFSKKLPSTVEQIENAVSNEDTKIEFLPPAPFDDSSIPVPGGIPDVPGFQILERVGEGSFGTVFKAFDNKLNRIVAIKFPRSLGSRSAKRFKREARLAAQLQHPNIVAIHDFVVDTEPAYLISEFIEGVTLSDWKISFEPSFEDIGRMIAKLAHAIHFAHDAGVVHRDIKPGNVIVDWNQEPHVLDFGLAKGGTYEDTLTAVGMVVGTPAYMSPEQARADQGAINSSTDIYSLGVLLYELLTGELPFRGTRKMLIEQIQTTPPAEPRRLDHRIPLDLETICLRCLEKLPEKRFETALEVAEELDRFVKGEPIKSRPLTRLNRTLRWCSQNQLTMAIAAAVAVSLLGGLSYTTYTAFSQAKSVRRSESFAYAMAMRNVESEFFDGQIENANTLLKRFDSNGKTNADPKWEWHFWNGICSQLRLLDMPVDNSIESVQYSPDQNWIAWSDSKGCLNLKSLSTDESGAEETTKIDFPSDRDVSALSWLADSSRLLTSHDNGEMRLWNVQGFGDEKPESKIVATLDGVATHIACDKDSEVAYIVRASDGTNAIGKLSLSTGTVEWIQPELSAPVVKIELSPNCELLAWSQLDQTVKVMNVANGKTIFSNDQRERPTECFGFFDNRNFIYQRLSTDKTSVLQMLNLIENSMLEFGQSESTATYEQLDVKESRVATTLDDGYVVIFDVNKEDNLASIAASFAGPKQAIKDVTFAKNSDSLLISRESTLAEWRIPLAENKVVTQFERPIKKLVSNQEGIQFGGDLGRPRSLLSL